MRSYTLRISFVGYTDRHFAEQIDTDGSISYRGNESVAIHINGEPVSLQGQSLVSYLRSLPANAVQRVEIIPNPSAKYEPEGMHHQHRPRARRRVRLGRRTHGRDAGRRQRPVRGHRLRERRVPG